MASVDRVETPMMVKLVARSFFGSAGNAAEIAAAAEAPQIAVAPPDSRPNSGLKPIALAAQIEARIVNATTAMTSTTGCQPSATTWAIVMRKPSKATPNRRIVRLAKDTPALQR